MLKIAVGSVSLALAYVGGLRVGSGWDALYVGVAVLLMVVAVSDWQF